MPISLDTDLTHLLRAIALAESGRGRVSPNPLVGAVVVRDGKVLGEGFHAAYGEAHAERAALAACTEDPRGATLYVSLEPCCHHGQTPPCTDAIIEAGHRAASSSPPTTRPRRPPAAGSGSCATRGSRSWSPTASPRCAPGCSTRRSASTRARAARTCCSSRR